MNVIEKRKGIHTVMLYAGRLKYAQVQKVIDHLEDMGQIRKKRGDLLNLDRQFESSLFAGRGLRFRIDQSHDCSNGIALIVNPSTLLCGEDRPLELYRPSRKTCTEIWKCAADSLVKIGLFEQKGSGQRAIVAPDDLSLSRMDLTVDYWLKDTDGEALIRLFSKGRMPTHFQPSKWNKETGKNLYFALESQHCRIKLYHKTFELKKSGRAGGPPCVTILRLEISLDREAFLKRLKADKDTSAYELLECGDACIEKIVWKYLEKMFPCTGDHLRYDAARGRIMRERELEEEMREQILFVLKKTSKGSGLDTALKKLTAQFGPEAKTGVLAAFDRLGINPITLPNESKLKQCPSLRQLLEVPKEARA